MNNNSDLIFKHVVDILFLNSVVNNKYESHYTVKFILLSNVLNWKYFIKTLTHKRKKILISFINCSLHGNMVENSFS